MKLEEKLLTLCQVQNLTLGFAESCTGGALAARITRIAGASSCFAGSIVSYQNHVKEHLLHVPQAYLQQYTAISFEVTQKMLESCLLELDADIGAAITGIAGPTGGNAEIPVGTIYIAVGKKASIPKLLSFHCQGSRVEIIEDAVDKVLLSLIQLIETAL